MFKDSNFFKILLVKIKSKPSVSLPPVFVATGGKETDGFDFIFTNKILKKFESLNIAFLKDELKELEVQLDKLYGKNTFPMAHAYIQNLLKSI